jgi:hypothetical protein
LLSVLRDPALQKSSKAWYLLRVQALQVLAFYLSLSSNLLSSALREQLWDQGERMGLLAFLGMVMISCAGDFSLQPSARAVKLVKPPTWNLPVPVAANVFTSAAPCNNPLASSCLEC